MSNENVIEVINTDYVISIDKPDNNLDVENIILSDYKYSPNKPQINSVELIGNKTAQELDLVSIADVANKENVSNKVVSINAQSTDTQYPSAKCVYTSLSSKANSSDVYTKAEVYPKADVYTKTDVYTKSEVYTKADIYTKSETNGLLADKLSATVPHIIDKKEPTASDPRGYIVFSNGYCIQWGNVIATGNATWTLSFVKKFKDTHYAIFKNNGANSTDSSSARAEHFYNLTVTSAQTYVTAGQATYGKWQASGFLAQGEY